LTENNEEKPEVKLVQSKEMTPLFTIEICEPVKEQLNKIEICGPNISIKPCSPINEMKCLPDASTVIGPKGCGPIVHMSCLPIIPMGCGPIVHVPLQCSPTISSTTSETKSTNSDVPVYVIGIIPLSCGPRVH
jgi:hypothetical protein